MRDMVEIGMGRTARRTYELGDINIVPSRRTRSSKDVSTAWQLDAYRFEIPVLAHPTDALVSPEFAIELGRLGGLGILNGEGLLGRHADVEARIAEVVDIAAKEPDPSASVRLLQQLHSAPIDLDLLGAAVARIGRRASPLPCGSRRRMPRPDADAGGCRHRSARHPGHDHLR